MENMMIRNQTRMPSAALSIHRDSQTISKAKPKIRIIHIFAPEIIKTDVANFRELVQRLTGKPSQEKGFKNKARNNSAICRTDEQQESRKSTFCVEKPVARKMELRSGLLAGLETAARGRLIKEEEEGLWINHGDNSGSFLSGFGDLDGFIHEFDEFPLLPLDVTSHHMHGFEEAQLA